ncbi:MAG: hypothetical protein Q7R95_09785, partial [bacterium]|nr:hypothetical protein [bacterium]
MKGSFQETKFGKELEEELNKVIQEKPFKNNFRNYWTEKEDYILKRLYGKVNIDEIMVFLQNRTKLAIQKRAEILELTKKRALYEKNPTYLDIVNKKNKDDEIKIYSKDSNGKSIYHIIPGE